MPQRKRASLLTQKRVAVVVNPYSAQRRWERNPKLRQYLHRKFPGRVFDQTGDKAEMIAQVKRLSQENDIIIALGGDGTLADVMQGIFEAGREKEMKFVGIDGLPQLGSTVVEIPGLPPITVPLLAPPAPPPPP